MSEPIPVIYNPTAGGGRARRARSRFESEAARLDVAMDWRATQAPGHASELAAEAAWNGHPLVLAFGGDGTYNEVARGLLGTNTAMGAVPAGTTSVLAFEFGIPRPVERSLLPLLRGPDRSVRVGRTDRDDLVLLMLSAGPDAMVLDRLHPWLKPLGGRFGVAVQALAELVRPAPLPVFDLDIEGVHTESGWAIVGKGRCYAGPYQACPGADPAAPAFETVHYRGRSRRRALSFSGALARSRHLELSFVERHRSERVRLAPRTGSPAAAYQIDGDFKGRLPVEVWIDPRALHVRLPE